MNVLCSWDSMMTIKLDLIIYELFHYVNISGMDADRSDAVFVMNDKLKLSHCNSEYHFVRTEIYMAI